MIKTSELMLGNLVEYEGKYYVVEGIGKEHINIIMGKVACEFINPIPLTDAVLNRLKVKLLAGGFVHQLQNYKTNNESELINITPLLAPRYTTHDGVEVWKGDEVYVCFKGGINLFSQIKDKPSKHNIDVQSNISGGILYFSTQQACQAYIDSQTRKPIFTTVDGVNIFEGDEYWYVNKDGRKFFDGLDKVGFICANFSGKAHDLAYFSTFELAQAYLNKVWAEKEYNDLISKK